METNIEGKIRSKIEAILINDARGYAEIRAMASEDEPLEIDPLAEERNLYQRIINSYRSGIGEVNTLLEENVGFISALYRIAETLREKEDFREICSQTVECLLHDMGAEFCCLYFRPREEWGGNPLIVEGIKESQKLIFSHSNPSLLGNHDFAQVLDTLVDQTGEFLNVADVYREPRFHTADFPSVVRSLICLPVHLHGKPAGLLALSHSVPRAFSQNQARVLRILASMISHFLLLTGRKQASGVPMPNTHSPAAEIATLSVVLLNIDGDALLSSAAMRESVRGLRRHLVHQLHEKESLLPSGEVGILVLLPNVDWSRLLERTSQLRMAFEGWRDSLGKKAEGLRLSLGCATCVDGDELTRAIEMAGHIMQCGREDSQVCAGAPASLPV